MTRVGENEMSNPGYIALSRMIAQQRALDVRAANIANVGTPGFKAEETLFSDYLVRQAGVSAPPGGRTVSMVQDRATFRDFAQGELSKTGNPLDLALQGDGFFAVQTPRGERYTRAGRFSLSPTGQIVDVSGNAVLGIAGSPITVPPGDTNIVVAGDATVSTESGPIGKLRIVGFDNPQSLAAEGSSLFAANQPPRGADQVTVAQGAVEGTNIKNIAELTSMMSDLREFEFASQFADAEAQREQTAIEKIGHKT